MNASPGAAVGKAVFDSDTRGRSWAGRGEKVILVRRETNPDDLHGMIAAQGILTSRGGKTTHAAVVARGMGKTCVCGAEELDVDTKRRRFTAPDGTVDQRGRRHLHRRHSGRVYLGEVPVVPSAGRAVLRGQLDADADEADDLVQAVHRDHVARRRGRRLRVRANADTARGRRAGPAVRRRGHRPVPHRAHVPGRAAPARRAADPGRGRRAARAGAGGAAAVAAADFVGIFTAMDGLPVDDPAARPAAARVPAGPHRAVGAGGAGRGAAGEKDENDLRLCRPCTRCTSRTRCSACAGSGSAWSSPACSTMQVRAIAEAAAS